MLLNITTCDMLLKLLLLLSVKRNANVRKRFLTSSVIVFRKFMFHLSQLKSSSYVTIYFIFLLSLQKCLGSNEPRLS